MESLGHLQQISNMFLVRICQNQLVNLGHSSTFEVGKQGSLGIASVAFSCHFSIFLSDSALPPTSMRMVLPVTSRKKILSPCPTSSMVISFSSGCLVKKKRLTISKLNTARLLMFSSNHILKPRKLTIKLKSHALGCPKTIGLFATCHTKRIIPSNHSKIKFS